MRPRCTLSAGELEPLYAELDRRLASIVLPTQPEVGMKILALVSDADAGMRQYADVIRSDAALTGRLLRLANSAFFAQRKPVTNLERACVLLGMGRLKALALGFYLSRAATGDPSAAFSRRIWGEGVFRACLASELVKRRRPALSSEAFVVGLMLDAGLPLLHTLQRDRLDAILEQRLTPGKQYQAEFAGSPYTHVDIAAALVRRWRLPDMLARPIEWHHTRPGDIQRAESVHVLHRAAYYVGAIRLDGDGLPDEMPPLQTVGECVLSMDGAELGQAARDAIGEYRAMREMFGDFADSLEGSEGLADRVHRQLVTVVDDALSREFRETTRTAPERFEIAGFKVEIEADEQGRAVAFLRDADGQRLLSHVISSHERCARTVLEALGVEGATPDQQRELDGFLRSMAA